MELKDLTGAHYLDAVDFTYEDGCNAVRFRLDGVVYTAKEDECDGYRSCMKEIYASEVPTITNTFCPVKVIAEYSNNRHDILTIKDATTGQPILQVGTNDNDDYYPYFVNEYTPEAMVTNQGNALKEARKKIDTLEAENFRLSVEIKKLKNRLNKAKPSRAKQEAAVSNQEPIIESTIKQAEALKKKFERN